MAGESVLKFDQYLNQLGSGKMQKPFKKIGELEIMETYKMLRKHMTTTKYGKSVITELEECSIFLSKRLADSFANNEEQFNNLQENVTYLRITEFNTGKFSKYPIIEFPRNVLSNE